MGSDGMYRSAWKYADEIGKHNLVLLERYRTNAFHLSFTNANETHLIYMRPAFHALRDLYKMASPFFWDRELEVYEKEFRALRARMETYLTDLQAGCIEPDYTIIDKFDELEIKILKRMNKAGLLYASEKVIAEDQQIRNAYGTSKPRSKKHE